MCTPGSADIDPVAAMFRAYDALGSDDQRMVRELILRLSRKANGLRRKVIYEEDCG